MSYAQSQDGSTETAKRTPASLGKLALRSRKGKDFTKRTRAFRDLREHVAPVDLRSKLGRSSKQFRESLMAHVGNAPSATEAALIDLACQLDLRLQVLNAKFLDSDGEFSGFDSKLYLSWSNSLARLLAKLSLKGRQPARQTLSDYLNSQSSTRRVGGDSPKRGSNPPLARKRLSTGSLEARRRRRDAEDEG